MSVYHDDGRVVLHLGAALDVARELETGSVQTIVTSPPYYGLRDYGHDEQLGAEATLAEYVANLVEVFRELRRVLADDGTLWVNLGDSYAGRANAGPAYTGNHKEFGKEGRVPPRKSTTADAPYKNLLGVPWRVAFGLQDDGWILRSDVIWAKTNPMPESVTDRPTSSHEYLFLLSKRKRYHYDAGAIAEDATRATTVRLAQKVAAQAGSSRAHGGAKANGAMRAAGGTKVNKRSVWQVATVPFSEAHFATYPPALIRPCILASAREGDVVLDPFSGSGTTGMVALQHGRRYVGIDVNADYLDLSLRTRFAQQPLDLGGVSA